MIATIEAPFDVGYDHRAVSVQPSRLAAPAVLVDANGRHEAAYFGSPAVLDLTHAPVDVSGLIEPLKLLLARDIPVQLIYSALAQL